MKLTGFDLRRARHKANLSMQRLAVRLGLLSHANIGAVENETRIASQKWLQEAIDACATPLTEEEKLVCGWSRCSNPSNGFYYCLSHRQKSAELTRKSQRKKRQMTIEKVEKCDFDRIILEETPQAIRIAEWMRLKHKDASILDVGCGPGIYVKAMRDAGLNAFGVDNDERLVEGDLGDGHPTYCWRANVTERYEKYISDAPCHYGVVLSLEVGEHIPHHDHNDYLKYILTIFGNRDEGALYFSAARPGQGGEGHISCEPKAYWVEKLYHAGFWLDPDATDEWLNWMRGGYHLGWLTQNGLVFRRG